MRTVLAGLIMVALATPVLAQSSPAMPVNLPPSAAATDKPVTITVTYTDKEAAVLLRLLDLAVRQAGLEAAGNAAVLANKIKDAAKAAGITQATPPPKQGASP